MIEVGIHGRAHAKSGSLSGRGGGRNRLDMAAQRPENVIL